MRIVVVEDEDRIREGIIKLLNKISPFYEVVGEAEDGLAGLERISELKPDLVITDIKMPEMGGIEMLMQLKERGIKHRSVILSGYSDFEYAQKAIKTGVCEYLLKPVTAKDLEQVLKNVEKEISMEQMLEAKQPYALNSLEYIFHNIVINDFREDPELHNYLHEIYGVDAKGDFVAVSIYLGSGFEEAKSRVKQRVAALLDKVRDIKYCLLELVLHAELIAVIYRYKDPHELEKYFQNIVIKEVQREGIPGSVFGMIPFKDLNDFKHSLQTLRKELKWSIVLGEDILISFPKTRQINSRIIQYPIDIESNAKAAVYAFDLSRLQKNFEEFLAWWRRELYQPAGVIEAFIRFASTLINAVKEINYELFDRINQSESLQRIMDAITWEELKKALLEILQKLSSYQGREIPVLGLVVKKTLSLVDEFYRDGITLEEIAARLKITPEYLGSLFLKEMGMHFSTYIKDYRITKAKELLVGSNLKTYEIAGKVGYPDPKYFSRVFKEATGLTPGAYQKTYK